MGLIEFLFIAGLAFGIGYSEGYDEGEYDGYFEGIHDHWMGCERLPSDGDCTCD